MTWLPVISQKKLLKQLSTLSKVAGYKINIEKSIVFLYTSKWTVRSWNFKRIPLTVKYLIPKGKFHKRYVRPLH